jgi:hypothetical protein
MEVLINRKREREENVSDMNLQIQENIGNLLIKL